ncbi:glutamic acid-rich protein-like [Palaemon carinicauda]|uniref:glutamic acid-rich protein-like n=1 Tax=Palaemon carinicauda TaxID=392227 RepID=UPI0035B65EBB
MPARPRGRGFRGGGRSNYGNHWMGHRGGNSRGGGRGMGHYGGRPDHFRGRRDMHNPHRGHDPEKLLSSLGPEAQLALTTAIINTVLKNDGRGGRGGYRGRDYHPRHGGSHRGGYFQEESRDRRHFGDDRRSHEPRQYHEEGRGHHYEREKSTSGSPRYRNNRYSAMPRRRPSPHGHPGPSHKRQRMERMDSMESDSSLDPSHNFDEEKASESGLERERFREREHKSQDSGENKKEDDKEEGSNGAGGMQVTIGADGERAVNNEGRGRPRVGGRLFVELRCPHCPSQRSITFKEYKYHLGSEGHKNQLSRLARKHSVVLRKIRVQQRQEQRDIEIKWKEEQSEEFKSSVTRFCNTCKLAFKCLGGNTGEGIDLHNSSKLHRMQKCYLHPRCSICHVTFPSRMVYEYHIASISHLRVRTATIERTGGHDPTDEQEQEEEEDELDLANFLTLDSVGEDDDVGSEHEEITRGLDDEEAAKEGERKKKKQSSGTRYKRDIIDDDELSTEADWDKDPLDDEEMEENEAVGTEYVNRIEVYFCSLCSKVIRANTSLGSRTVQRHCRSSDHLANYWDAHPAEKKILSEDEAEDEKNSKVEREEYKCGEGEEPEAAMEDDPEQEHFWDEVNKSLDILQGTIMTEIDDSFNSVNEEATTEEKIKSEVEENTVESTSELKEVVEDSEEETDSLEKSDVRKQERDHKITDDFLEDIAEDSEEDT